MSMTRVMRKAGVILTSRDTTKVLAVINRNCFNPLKFGLPKGHREEKETLEQCASRELKEETGILVRVSARDPKIVVSETTYYLIKAAGMPKPCPHDCTEIGDARWVKWEDIFANDCNRGLRLIRDKIQRGNAFMKRLRDLSPRSVGISRKKPSHSQDDTKHSSSTKRTRGTKIDGPDAGNDDNCIPNTTPIDCEQPN